MFDRFWKRRPKVAADRARPMRIAGGAPTETEIDDSFLSRLRRVTLASERRLTSGITGEHPSPRRAQALEFADYRSYSPGDDLRRVDWNAYLRLGHLFVKLADAPERLTLHLLLDASRSMAWGHPDKFTYARRLAVGLSYVALAHMDAASISVLNGNRCLRLRQVHGLSSAATMVRDVGGLEAHGPTDLDAALASFASQANHRGVGILISDLLSPTGYQAGLERLSRVNLRPVLIHVVSPDEMRPSMEGDLELEDVETGDLVPVSIDYGTLNRYQRWLREWLAEIESFCARRGITYVRVETSEPLEQLLLERLRRERVLR